MMDIWLSRDKGPTEYAEEHYELWVGRISPVACTSPTIYGDAITYHSSLEGKEAVTLFCAREFERVTGFHIEPGECAKVTIEVKRA